MAIYARLENGTYAEVTGVYKTDGTEITEIFQGDRLVYSASNEIYGSLPLYYNGKGYDLTDYLISGNAVQDGTPTPENPVDASGSGARTGNLFDFEQLKNAPSGTIEGANFSHLLELQLKANTYYTMASNGTGSTNLTPADMHRSVYFNSKTGEASVNKNHPVTALTDSTGIVRIGFVSERTNAQQYLNGEAQLWINEGDTLLPYEPYGYKLPLTVNGVEYPIYLGTVPTTRRIKKLVLTGGERFIIPSISLRVPIGAYIPCIAGHALGVVNTHFITNNSSEGSSTEARMYTTRLGATGGVIWFFIPRNFFSGELNVNNCIAEWKSYLAAQYANGTPVTVWYVLATPEIAVVNEPLMNIGDYADTVSAAQAGVTMPTVNGANVLDMNSPVKPSEVYIKGKGIKPTGYGQLTDVNGVNILDKDGRPIYVHGQ